MKLDGVIKTIRSHREDLAGMGVRHAAVFGSTARGDAGPDSDVDILLDVDPARVRSIFAMGRIQASLQAWLGHAVDVTRQDRLPGRVSEAAEREAVHAF